MKTKLYIPLIHSWIVALKWNAFANQPACAIDYTRRVAGVWWKRAYRACIIFITEFRLKVQSYTSCRISTFEKTFLINQAMARI